MSKGLEKYNRMKKEETLNKLQDAIDRIRSTGNRVTRKELLNITQLSSATLSKPYVKELFQKNKVLMYEETKSFSPTQFDEDKGLRNNIKELIRENERLQHQISDLKAINDMQGNQIKKLKDQINSLDTDNQLLRGKLQTVLEYIMRIGKTDDETIIDFFKY